MPLSNLAPNTAILKSPSNWFLVAFCVILLAFLFHLVTKGNK